MYQRNPLAYPRSVSIDENGDRPEAHQSQHGITLYDLAALHALQGILAGRYAQPNSKPESAARITAEAFQYADAFLKERNRPGDEARAKRDDEVKAGRELVTNGRYIIGGDKRTPMATSIANLEYVWDRTEKTIVVARKTADVDARPQDQQWKPFRVDQQPGMLRDITTRMNEMEDFIQREQPLDLKDWGLEVTDTLPAWA